MNTTTTPTVRTVPMTEPEFDHLAETDMAAYNLAVLHRMDMTDEHDAGHDYRPDCYRCVE